MYKKGAALELQFSPARLNDGAGDPFWIDLTYEEVHRLHVELTAYLSSGAQIGQGAGPLVVTLDRSTHADTPQKTPVESPDFKQWVCVICGWIYDEAVGDVDHGIAPGTRWEDVPDHFRCPLCDVGKEDFALVEF
jgi:rubredoxin